MKLGILHFTDSHIKSATDWILSEFSSLVASVKEIIDGAFGRWRKAGRLDY